MKHTLTSFANLAFIVIVVLITASLTGCFATTGGVAVETKIKYQEVPAYLTQQIVPNPPVSKADYLAKSILARESYLADYTVQTLKDLQSCNANLESISVLSSKWKANNIKP